MPQRPSDPAAARSNAYLCDAAAARAISSAMVERSGTLRAIAAACRASASLEEDDVRRGLRAREAQLCEQEAEVALRQAKTYEAEAVRAEAQAAAADSSAT